VSIIAIALIGFSIFLLPTRVPNPVYGEFDDVRPLSKSLSGGGILGDVNNQTCYAEKFEITGDTGLGLFGSFSVAANSWITFFVTNEQGWIDFCEDGTTSLKWGEISDTNAAEDWHVPLPYAGTWYAVYSRAWYTDLAKTVTGYTYRDLTAPEVIVNLPLATSFSGQVPINFTVDEIGFNIARIEVYVDDQILQIYDQDMGKHFEDVLVWDTPNWFEGSHILRFRTFDTVGNQRDSIRVVKVYNTVDITTPSLFAIGLLAFILLAGLHYKKELSLLATIVGLVCLVICTAVSYGFVILTIYDVNEAIGLITGTIAMVGIPFVVAKGLDELRKPN
jgi:hypothetical protein